MQVPERTKKQTKFSPRAIEGVILGCHLSSGGQWKGDFYVTQLSDLKNADPSREKRRIRVSTPRTSEVSMILTDGDFTYPLEKAHDAYNRGIAPPVAPDDAGGRDDDEAPEDDVRCKLPGAKDRHVFVPEWLFSGLNPFTYCKA